MIAYRDWLERVLTFKEVVQDTRLVMLLFGGIHMSWLN